MVPAPISLLERMIDAPVHALWEARQRSRLQTEVSTDMGRYQKALRRNRSPSGHHSATHKFLCFPFRKVDRYARV